MCSDTKGMDGIHKHGTCRQVHPWSRSAMRSPRGCVLLDGTEGRPWQRDRGGLIGVIDGEGEIGDRAFFLPTEVG